ncbi:unnamed protein product [Heterosigma akashiwo]
MRNSTFFFTLAVLGCLLFLARPSASRRPDFEDSDERKRREERRKAWEKEVAEHVEPDPPERFEYKTGECFEDEGRRLCMPTFVYAGCGHCGTTSLLAMLRQHPNIEIPQHGTHWWGGAKNPRKNRWDQEEYAKKLANSRNIEAHHITADFSIRYKADPEAPYQLAKMFPDIKIIMMVREPGEQCFSTINYNQRSFWRENRPPKQTRNESVCLKEYIPDHARDSSSSGTTTACDQPEYSLHGLRPVEGGLPAEGQALYLQSEELASRTRWRCCARWSSLGVEPHEGYEAQQALQPSRVLMSGQKREMRPEMRVLFDACFTNTSLMLEEFSRLPAALPARRRQYWYDRPGFALDWSEPADAKQIAYERRLAEAEEL